MVNDDGFLTPEHCRAARALLGWSQDELADKAGVSRNVVKKVEAGLALSPLSARAMQGVFEGAGVHFVRDGTTLDGVVLTRGVAIRRRRD